MSIACTAAVSHAICDQQANRPQADPIRTAAPLQRTVAIRRALDGCGRRTLSTEDVAYGKCARRIHRKSLIRRWTHQA